VDGELESMPNIGKKLAQELREAGIRTPAALKALGGRAAFKRIRAACDTGCLSKLCALEGAVQGVRWHSLAREERADLKRFLDALDAG
jgi:DNA transformation protein